jgi:hypothetical protein
VTLLHVQVTIRVEKGVDVSLTLEMTKTPPPGIDYSVLIVITGDGDLEEAFRLASSQRATYVLPLKATLSTGMDVFVHKPAGEEQAWWLDRFLAPERKSTAAVRVRPPDRDVVLGRLDCMPHQVTWHAPRADTEDSSGDVC